MQVTKTFKVSIILPVYNGVDCIADAIESILQQSFQDFELLVVENGSSDGTKKLLLQYADHPKVEIYNLEKANLVEAINYGLQQSRGEYIARMDADDISHIDRLQKQIDFFGANPELGLVATQVEFKSSLEKSEGLAFYVEWQNRALTTTDIELRRFIESPIAHPTVMIKREILIEAGGWRDGQFPEDYELWLRLMDGGIKMAKIPEKLLIWSDHGERLTRSDDRYAIKNFYSVKSKYLARWIEQRLENFQDGKPLYIWGAGKKSSKNARLLEQFGIKIDAFIDVDPKKIGKEIDGREIISYLELDRLRSAFILSYVGNRGKGVEILEYLLNNGFKEGRDFLLAAF